MRYVMLKVYARSEEVQYSCVEYDVTENGDGFLWTKVAADQVRSESFVFKFPMMKSGYMVSESDAETITGLHCPAAWDRLREMVQDSGVYHCPAIEQKVGV